MLTNLIKFINRYREIITYLIQGVLTTIVSWGTFSIFIYFVHLEDNSIYFSMPLNILLASLFSWICAVLFSFVLSKLWVFESKTWLLKIVCLEAFKFISSRFLTGLLETISVPFVVFLGMDQSICGIDGMLAKVVVSLLFVVVNYIVSKFWVFR